MSADIKIGWMCYEQHGVAVLKDLITQDLLLSRDDIKPNDEVYVATLFGGYVKAIVANNCDYAETEHNIYFLEFDKDDRHCWSTASAGNKKALAKLNFDMG